MTIHHYTTEGLMACGAEAGSCSTDTSIVDCPVCLDLLHRDPQWVTETRLVLNLVLAERKRQVARYGFNEALKDGTGPDSKWLYPFTGMSAQEIEPVLRQEYVNFEARHGLPTWLHLVREEIAEAFQETNPERLTAELIQVAALCVSWIERIRARRG